MVGAADKRVRVDGLWWWGEIFDEPGVVGGGFLPAPIPGDDYQAMMWVGVQAIRRQPPAV